MLNNATFASPRQDKSTTSPCKHCPAFNVNQKDSPLAVTADCTRRTHTGDVLVAFYLEHGHIGRREQDEWRPNYGLSNSMEDLTLTWEVKDDK